MRIFGINCRLLMAEQGISSKEFAEKLGYSRSDVKRLLLFTDDIKDIAEFFRKNPDKMFEFRGTDEYKRCGLPQCIGNFSNPENMDFVMDLIDQYCTLAECVE